MAWWVRGLKVRRIRVVQVGNGDCLAGLAVPGHEAALMASVMFVPSFSFPEPTCLLSSHSGLAVQMRKRGLFVYCSVLAMDKMSGPDCFRTKFSPSNLPADGLGAGAIMVCEFTALAHEP